MSTDAAALQQVNANGVQRTAMMSNSPENIGQSSDHAIAAPVGMLNLRQKSMQPLPEDLQSEVGAEHHCRQQPCGVADLGIGQKGIAVHRPPSQPTGPCIKA